LLAYFGTINYGKEFDDSQNSITRYLTEQWWYNDVLLSKNDEEKCYFFQTYMLQLFIKKEKDHGEKRRNRDNFLQF